MIQRIWSPLCRVLIHVLALLAPATGQRRAAGSRVQATCPSRTVSGLRLVVRAVGPPRLPAVPRPYGWRGSGDDRPVLDSASPLVRPYFLAHERRLAAEVASPFLAVYV